MRIYVGEGEENFMLFSFILVEHMFWEPRVERLEAFLRFRLVRS